MIISFMEEKLLQITQNHQVLVEDVKYQRVCIHVYGVMMDIRQISYFITEASSGRRTKSRRSARLYHIINGPSEDA